MIRLLSLSLAFFAFGPSDSHAVTVTFDHGAGEFSMRAITKQMAG